MLYISTSYVCVYVNVMSHAIRHVCNVHDIPHVCTCYTSCVYMYILCHMLYVMCVDVHAIHHVCTDAHAILHVCTDAHAIHVCI